MTVSMDRNLQLSLDVGPGALAAVAPPAPRGAVAHPVWPEGMEGFHPAVATWFARRFAEGPTPPQVQGWPLIAAGHDTLIAAPTGSGKTLAGFLVAIDALYRAHDRGEPVADVARVVYVSPLKALAVDIAENLDRPLTEIAAVAADLGLDAPPIRVAVRTGDTTSSQRASMVRRPPSFVVTTPESLYLLVTSAKGRDALRTVETVIVDEIHAVARDKRGAHLALTLERLEALCERRPARIGLSATQRPIETVGRLLVGDRPLPAVVDVGHQRDLDLALELPEGELEAVATAEQMGDVLDRIAALVAEHRTTLVFVNTRRLAERLAHQLEERLGADVVSAHHGSLSKERRHRVETRLRAGDLRVLVATASLELGIDIGPVELVCQVGSPRSIATFLQRVGRSNHSRAGTPKGRLFPMTRDELVECSALLAAVGAGRLDTVELARLPLDIVAQQVVAEVGAREWTTDGLYDLVRRAAPYTGLTRAQFDEIVALVAAGIETGRGKRGAYVYHDPVNGELRPRGNARLAAATSGGAIPETGDYRVVAEPDDTFIGTVNEDWAVESMAGDIFLLGTHSWQIRRVEPGVVRVRDAGDTPPTVPFWLGEAPARTDELSQEVSALRARVDAFLEAGDPDGARRWLAESIGVGADAATMIVDYLAVGRAALGAMPTHDCLVLERFFDDTGGMQLVVHSPYGGRVNRALGLALRKKFCRSFNFELQAAATDDAIVLSLGPHHSFPLDEVPRYVSSRTLRDTLEQAILDKPMFQARWRWNLNRSLMVLRFRGGRRNPPPIQRMESDDLMAAVFPQAAACQENVTGPIEIPDHLLVRQTIDDTLNEALDVDGLAALLTRIEAGEVRVHCADTTEASVLAHEIVTARPYAFLDDEELQNRRTNAVTLRRGLTVDMASIGALDPDAVARVHDEIVPDPASADDLCDLVASLVVVRPRPEWAALWSELVARGRGLVRESAGVALWSATEVAELADRALAGDEDAVTRAVRGHLEITGITTVAGLVEATTLPEARVTYGLLALQTEGFAMQGRYTPGPVTAPGGDGVGGGLGDGGGVGDGLGDGGGVGGEVGGEVEWVARRLLARMHSYSRKSRRRSVQPATVQDLMRFLLRWQHVAPGTQLSGDAGLLAVLEQLQGYEAAAFGWEPELLARRMRHYDAAWLDRWCHDGHVAWLRLTPPARDDPDVPRAAPSKATPIAVVLRDDLPWLLAAARTGGAASEPTVGAAAEIVEVLRERGACFAGDLAAATRRLPEDIERGLWDGVARGLIMSDGFGAIRARVAGGAPTGGSSGNGRPGPRHLRTQRLTRLSRAGRSTSASAGRWSLVPDAGPLAADLDRDELAETVAEQLLHRWGVVFRDLALRDSLRLPWREIQWALRRLEDRGLIRGGRFVAGFPGEQYALPDAAEQLAHVRKLPTTGERVTVNATDPLNLVGVIVPGPTVPAVRTNRVTYVDGVCP
ncbi:MAG TPA: DEAD/DEAH box helicase [Acidimicrobiales bacterium]|nr:DEAD/DEAH box helicase [Acidimicrobiales bacterium]